MTDLPHMVDGEVIAVATAASAPDAVLRAQDALALTERGRPVGDTHAPVSLPPPDVLRRFLRVGLHDWYGRQAAVRPEHVPEDTFPIQRRLANAHETFSEYAAAFRAAAAHARACQEAELAVAVGTVSDTDDTPRRAITVPDGRGDIRISPEHANTWTIDIDQLIGVVVEEALLKLTHPVEFNSAENEILEDVTRQAAQAALATLMELGKFEPQISKVRAWAAALSRRGNDKMAAVVTSTIRGDRAYKGVKVERKDTR